MIVWFRDDLRLSDHPALHAAAETGAPLVCLYVLDEESSHQRPPRGRPIGSASRLVARPNRCGACKGASLHTANR